MNNLLFPLKMVIPQPVLAKIPGLWTNEDIRFRYVLRHIEGRLLDIGCGKNRMVEMYRRGGGEGTGVDVFSWNDDLVLVEDTANLPFDSGGFDSVTFVASINHIPNRLEVLKEARRVLADNGRLIMTMLTPFIGKIWHRWAFWDEDQHVRGMQEGEAFGLKKGQVIEWLDQAGFDLIDMKAFSWKLNRLFLCRKKR
jgi:ubiquinone/menaquinone biosynthesis C-methylase UbiE